MSPGKAKKANGAQSIERAMTVLRAVAAAKSNGSTLSQVVTASRLNKATVHRLLSVLAREGLIERMTRRRPTTWASSSTRWASLAAPRFGLHQLAMPGLRRLAALSEDSAFLCLLSGNDVVCVHREEGSHPIRTHVMQGRDPLSARSRIVRAGHVGCPGRWRGGKNSCGQSTCDRKATKTIRSNGSGNSSRQRAPRVTRSIRAWCTPNRTELRLRCSTSGISPSGRSASEP